MGFGLLRTEPSSLSLWFAQSPIAEDRSILPAENHGGKTIDFFGRFADRFSLTVDDLVAVAFLKGQ